MARIDPEDMKKLETGEIGGKIAPSAADAIFSDRQEGNMQMGEQLLDLRTPNALLPLYDQMIQVITDARDHYLKHTGSPVNQILLVRALLEGTQAWISGNISQLPEWMEKAIMVEFEQKFRKEE